MRMRFIFLFLLPCLCSAGLDRARYEELRDDPVVFLDRVAKAAAEMDSRPKAEVKELADDLQNLNYVISQELSSVRSPDWTKPTDEKLAMIDKWAKIIQPYNKSLVETAMKNERYSPYEKFVRESRNVLYYTYPDEAFEGATRAVLSESENVFVYIHAARLLYEHRRLTESDKAVLLEKSEFIQDGDEEGELVWAKTISAYGMVEGIPVAKRLLEKPIPEGIGRRELEQYSGDLIGALFPIPSLGPDAIELLPLVEERLTEIQEIWPEYSGSRFTICISRMKGETPNPRRRARNGSGYLQNISAPLVSSSDEPPAEYFPQGELDNGNSVPGDLVSGSQSTDGDGGTSAWPLIALGIALLGVTFVLARSLLAREKT